MCKVDPKCQDMNVFVVSIDTVNVSGKIMCLAIFFRKRPIPEPKYAHDTLKT